MDDTTMQSMGGKARAAALSPERLKEIAQQGAQARWAIPRAIYGAPDRPLHIGKIEIPCYVLNDERRVLVQRAMVSALGMARGGSSRGGGDRLAYFVKQERLNPFVSNELRSVTEAPFRFLTPPGKIAYGYEAEVLARICFAVMDAERKGGLQDQQLHIAERCRILVEGFAIVGINALVDEATGYQDVRDKLALAKILEKYLLTEGYRKWERLFPLDYYKEMFRLRGWTFDPASTARPGIIGKITNNIIYDRLQPGILKKLRELNPRDETGRRKRRHHQYFTGEIGVPELKELLSNVTILMRVSNKWERFIEMLDHARPRVGDTLRLPLEFKDE